MNIRQAHEIQKHNWRGGIPVVLSLARTSLTAPTPPEAIYKILPRNTYLHLYLENEVRFFYRYAPFSSFSTFQSVSQNDDGDTMDDSIDKDKSGDAAENLSVQKDPSDGRLVGSDTEDATNKENEAKDWGESEKETNQSKEVPSQRLSHESTLDDDNNASSSSYPVCWFEDEATGTPLRWHLFVGILYDMIQLRQKQKPCPTETHGEVGTNMIPWKIRVHFTSYPQPPALLPLKGMGGTTDVAHLVFQSYLNSLKQALYIQHQSNKIAKNLNKKSHMMLWDGIKRNHWDDAFDEIFSELDVGIGNPRNEDVAVVRQVPIRLLVDDQPPFSRPCPIPEGGITLKDILNAWLCNLFLRKFCCFVQGIQVPLDITIVDLWKTLCHPDRFLYIIIATEVIDDKVE